ncbi:MAG: hypothetical protein QM654_16425 [Dysgonamonadaceae bacterium]
MKTLVYYPLLNTIGHVRSFRGMIFAEFPGMGIMQLSIEDVVFLGEKQTIEDVMNDKRRNFKQQ